MSLVTVDIKDISEEVEKDNDRIRTVYEDERARATFDKFLTSIGILPDVQHKFSIGNSDSLYMAPNGRYVIALRYSKNYDLRFKEDPDRGHYWWTLDKLKDSFRSHDRCISVFFVFCCHTDCSNHVDMSLWQCCDEFLSVPVSVFNRHNVNLFTFRPHFYRSERGFEWRHDKSRIREDLNRYLNIHCEMFREYK